MFFKFERGSKSLECILASIGRKAILEGDDKSMSSKCSDSSLYVTPAPTIGVSAVAFFREFLHQIRKKYRPTTTESTSLPRLPSPDNIPIYSFHLMQRNLLTVIINVTLRYIFLDQYLRRLWQILMIFY